MWSSETTVRYRRRRVNWRQTPLDRNISLFFFVYLARILTTSWLLPASRSAGLATSCLDAPPLTVQWPPPSPHQEVAVVVITRGEMGHIFSCLDSWKRHTDHSYVYVVDVYGWQSQPNWVARLASYPNLTLLGDVPPWYERRGSVFNAGCRAAFAAGFEYIVQLQSDVALTANWLKPLITVLTQNSDVGAVTGIDDAWQNRVSTMNDVSSSLHAADLQPYLQEWATDNGPLKNAMVSKLAFLLSDNKLLELPTLSGSSVAYRREIFQPSGILHKLLFSLRSNAESNSALFIRQLGFRVVMTPLSYTPSIPGLPHHERRFAAERLVFSRRRSLFSVETTTQQQYMGVRRVQERLRRHFPASTEALRHDASALFILNPMSAKSQFVLRSTSVSLVQEALGLWQSGFYVRLAVPMHRLGDFARSLPRANAAGIFLGFVGTTASEVAGEILAAGTVYDFVVATHPSTTPAVQKICSEWTNAVPAYYVQDVDPDAERMAASFRAIPSEALTFVNTRWLQGQLLDFNVHAVYAPPKVDTLLYTPGEQTFEGPLQLCAMVSVEHGQQNPYETLNILIWAARVYGPGRMNATVFGCSQPDVTAYLRSKNDTAVEISLLNIAGIVAPAQMPELLRQCEIFLDFSSWQTFGRMGLEAMAAGVVPILPAIGSRHEFADPRIDSFVLDTSDEANAHEMLTHIMDGNSDLPGMRKAALATARRFSMETSSRVTAAIFRDFWARWRAERSLNLLL